MLKEGDKNTSFFFHEKASRRKARNIVSRIKDEHGCWCEKEGDIELVFVSYFEQIFQTQDNIDAELVTSLVRPSMTSELNPMLTKRIAGEEVYAAHQQMHPTKAPGPDGMSALFFQKFWHIVSRDVISFVLSVLNDGASLKSVNQTLIALIPKVKTPTTTKEFRPISLYNVLYKLISKTMANRLKECLHDMIHDSQSAFIPSQLITDNVLVALEHFHYLKKRPVGVKKGHMVLKLDMSKAYDSVAWKFIGDMMRAMGFDTSFVDVIMQCITTVSYQVLMNGKLSGTIVPHRGLHQGDPISP